jgi:hypothetical protein
MAQKKDNDKKIPTKSVNKILTTKPMTSAQLTQKAAGYLLAASNAAKREKK